MVPEAGDMTHIRAECIPVAADVGCILGGLPATDGTPSLWGSLAIFWWVAMFNFLCGEM